MDEVEYQKRRSQKITGYVCDSFVILYPLFTRKSEHVQLGVRVGRGGEAVSLYDMLTHCPLSGNCFLNLAVSGTNQQYPTNILHKNHRRTVWVAVLPIQHPTCTEKICFCMECVF